MSQAPQRQAQPSESAPAGPRSDPGTPVARPATALLIAGVATVLIVLTWRTEGALMAALIALASVLWVLNVALGGRINDSPLGAVVRLRRARRGR